MSLEGSFPFGGVQVLKQVKMDLPTAEMHAEAALVCMLAQSGVRSKRDHQAHEGDAADAASGSRRGPKRAKKGMVADEKAQPHVSNRLLFTKLQSDERKSLGRIEFTMSVVLSTLGHIHANLLRVQADLLHLQPQHGAASTTARLQSGLATSVRDIVNVQFSIKCDSANVAQLKQNMDAVHRLYRDSSTTSSPGQATTNEAGLRREVGELVELNGQLTRELRDKQVRIDHQCAYISMLQVQVEQQRARQQEELNRVQRRLHAEFTVERTRLEASFSYQRDCLQREFERDRDRLREQTREQLNADRARLQARFDSERMRLQAFVNAERARVQTSSERWHAYDVTLMQIQRDYTQTVIGIYTRHGVTGRQAAVDRAVAALTENEYPMPASSIEASLTVVPISIHPLTSVLVIPQLPRDVATIISGFICGGGSLDVAVIKNASHIVKLLVANGATATASTVQFAVTSSSVDIVQSVFRAIPQSQLTLQLLRSLRIGDLAVGAWIMQEFSAGMAIEYMRLQATLPLAPVARLDWHMDQLTRQWQWERDLMSECFQRRQALFGRTM